MEAEQTITRPVTPPSTAEREREEYMKINNYSEEKMKSIEINREKHLRKYKQSNEELEALEQRKKARQAQGVNPMDWTDPVASRKYINDLVSGKHRMKGRALTSKSVDKWPGLKAAAAAMAEEDEREEERIRQEEEQDYESDPELGQYTQGEINRAIERSRKYYKERDMVFPYDENGQPIKAVAKTGEGTTTRAVGAKREEGRTTSGGENTEDGVTIRVGVKTEEGSTMSGGSKMEEGARWVWAKAEEGITTGLVVNMDKEVTTRVGSEREEGIITNVEAKTEETTKWVRAKKTSEELMEIHRILLSRGHELQSKLTNLMGSTDVITRNQLVSEQDLLREECRRFMKGEFRSSTKDEDFDNRAIEGGQPKKVDVKTVKGIVTTEGATKEEDRQPIKIGAKLTMREGGKKEEEMTTRGGARVEYAVTMGIELKTAEETTTCEGVSTEDEETTGIGLKSEEGDDYDYDFNRAKTPIRPPLCEERSLGKEAKATYPTSCTEWTLGKVDSQGSQRWRRRKRDTIPRLWSLVRRRSMMTTNDDDDEL
jgi:hypothetical protein